MKSTLPKIGAGLIFLLFTLGPLIAAWLDEHWPLHPVPQTPEQALCQDCDACTATTLTDRQAECLRREGDAFKALMREQEKRWLIWRSSGQEFRPDRRPDSP